MMSGEVDDEGGGEGVGYLSGGSVGFGCGDGGCGGHEKNP
jgi:hypothetical protein